jgi:hypothetical protein
MDFLNEEFFMEKKLHDNNLLPKPKKHSELKLYGIWIFLKFNVCFYNLKSSRVLYNMQIVCNTHDIQKKVIAYDKKN